MAVSLPANHLKKLHADQVGLLLFQKADGLLSLLQEKHCFSQVDKQTEPDEFSSI